MIHKGGLQPEQLSANFIIIIGFSLFEFISKTNDPENKVKPTLDIIRK